ncbi:MAG: prepilin-type N-terminal cleavage/methylation domain-containing protein [Candidatus Omnitrophica bacterium]|nr:prepilin-type N-terminal cleavage/methylation domain-containing protein [Candidatus Omnitrophota bacterium]
MLSFRQKGFTLIELLIVIAIILILISIALPNFLEAQIRAKVTKVQGELRSLATAIEGYQVEWKTYPPDGDDIMPFNPGNFDVAARLSTLTTPVAFIKDLPFDPFHGDRVEFYGSDMLYPGEPPYTYSYNTFGTYAGDQFQPANAGKPDNFGLMSLGPNMSYDADYSGPKIYSPTNGTKSAGDILRNGGRRTVLSLP